MSRILAGALFGALSFMSVSSTASAESGEPAVREAIESLVPGAKIESISESVVAGLYEVTIDGRVVYVTAEGRYLLQGSIFDIPNRIDITEAGRSKIRAEALAGVTTGRIVFARLEGAHAGGEKGGQEKGSQEKMGTARTERPKGRSR